MNELQNELICEIENLTKGMALYNARGELTNLKGYPQAVPVLPVFELNPFDDSKRDEETEEKMFPYFVVRTDQVFYKKENADGKNQVNIIVLFAIRDRDPNMAGYFTLTAIVERVIARFQTNPALHVYWCERQMNVAFQEDNTFPYFFAGIEMTWNIPDLAVTGGY